MGNKRGLTAGVNAGQIDQVNNRDQADKSAHKHQRSGGNQGRVDGFSRVALNPDRRGNQCEARQQGTASDCQFNDILF